MTKRRSLIRRLLSTIPWEDSLFLFLAMILSGIIGAIIEATWNPFCV